MYAQENHKSSSSSTSSTSTATIVGNNQTPLAGNLDGIVGSTTPNGGKHKTISDKLRRHRRHLMNEQKMQTTTLLPIANEQNMHNIRKHDSKNKATISLAKSNNHKQKHNNNVEQHIFESNNDKQMIDEQTDSQMLIDDIEGSGVRDDSSINVKDINVHDESDQTDFISLSDVTSVKDRNQNILRMRATDDDSQIENDSIERASDVFDGRHVPNDFDSHVTDASAIGIDLLTDTFDDFDSSFEKKSNNLNAMSGGVDSAFTELATHETENHGNYGIKYSTTETNTIDDSDISLQNDSPVIITQFERQPKIDIELDEHELSKTNGQYQPEESTVSETPIILTTIPTELDTSYKPLDTNQIETKDNIQHMEIDTSTAIKQNEPRYGMLDGTLNNSIQSLTQSNDPRNMQRILVNVSIATDSGDGTQNHGIYMLHVSVPAGPNLQPAYFDASDSHTDSKASKQFNHGPKLVANRLPIEHDTKPQALMSGEHHFVHSMHHPIENLTDNTTKMHNYAQEILRLNSIIETLNKSLSAATNICNLNQTDDTKRTTNKLENSTMPISIMSNAEYNNNNNNNNSNEHFQNNCKECLCNQDIPPILILEGERSVELSELLIIIIIDIRIMFHLNQNKNKIISI